MGLRNKIDLFLFRKRWKKWNIDNSTIPLNVFDPNCVEIKKSTYGGIRIINYNNKYKLLIGNYCSIAQEVVFILDGDHYVNHISTFPFKAKILDGGLEGVSKGNIVVDDDVWIGYGCTIMSGVHIGQGAIIAAGAVVTKDVPPYAIVGGVPAKIIKYRFEPDMIEELLKIDYSKLTKEEIMNNIDDLYLELKDKKQFEWMPKK